MKKISITIMITCIFFLSGAWANAMEAKKTAVTDIRICTDIQSREPVGTDTVFSLDTPKIYCFTRVKSDMETTVNHVWYHEGQIVLQVQLNVGVSPGWRTYSSKTLREEDRGSWIVEVIGEDGTSLEMTEFKVN